MTECLKNVWQLHCNFNTPAFHSSNDSSVLYWPGLLASTSRMCSSVHSANECSRQSCRNRAWVRLTRFNSDSRATVCSHSFQPLNQLAKTPTWSRNIMVWWAALEHCTVGLIRVKDVFNNVGITSQIDPGKALIYLLWSHTQGQPKVNEGLSVVSSFLVMFWYELRFSSTNLGWWVINTTTTLRDGCPVLMR